MKKHDNFVQWDENEQYEGNSENMAWDEKGQMQEAFTKKKDDLAMYGAQNKTGLNSLKLHIFFSFYLHLITTTASEHMVHTQTHTHAHKAFPLRDYKFTVKVDGMNSQRITWRNIFMF